MAQNNISIIFKSVNIIINYQKWRNALGEVMKQSRRNTGGALNIRSKVNTQYVIQNLSSDDGSLIIIFACCVYRNAACQFLRR